MRVSLQGVRLSHATGFGPPRRRVALCLLAIVLLLQVVGIGLIFAWERALRRVDQEELVASLSLDKRWREHFAKAISRPLVAGVEEAKLPPDEVVVGIEV